MAECRENFMSSMPVSAQMKGRDSFQILRRTEGCCSCCLWSLLCLSQAECNKDTGSRTLVSGHIVGWEASAAFPLAQLRASLGQAGGLATEMQVRVCMMHQSRGICDALPAHAPYCMHLCFSVESLSAC